jgi:hypothetical protein
MILTIQYLESGPQLIMLDPRDVLCQLAEACHILPIIHLLIGWDIPPRLFQACREEVTHLGLRLLCWPPLLTGDGVLPPFPEWHVVGLDGNRVPAWQEKPKFTFLCPNHPSVQDAVQARLQQLVKEGDQDVALVGKTPASTGGSKYPEGVSTLNL